jgi:hypothetical protein
MPKLTVIISQEAENQLREYVTKKYPRSPFGKLSKVVDLAIKEYLQKEGTK